MGDVIKGFAVGETVGLKSGSPVMTVAEVYRPGRSDPAEGTVVCLWFDRDGEVNDCVFPIAALEPRGVPGHVNPR